MTQEQRLPLNPAAQQSHFSPASTEEINLLDLGNILWKGKWLIAGITSVFAVAAVIITLLMPNTYKSEALLAPVASEQQGMLASMAGQLGGLASLAGIDIGASGGVDKTTLALETLRSRAFITAFVRRHNLAAPLLASKGWDHANGEWVINEDVFDIKLNKWIRDAAPPKMPEPSDLELYEKFREMLYVGQDKKSSLVRLSIKSQSPDAAKQWVELLIQDINSYMRAQDIQNAKKSIQYLQGQLSKTSVTEMQNIFYQLIEQQTKTVMLAEVREEYIFKTIDPPVVPERKTEPKRALICIITVFAALLLSIMLVFARHAFVGAKP